MGKAPSSEVVEELVAAGKGHELVRLGRKGGGTIEHDGKTYRVMTCREAARKRKEEDD